MPKRYEAEFKKEIVSLYVEGGRSAKERTGAPRKHHL